MYKEYQPYPSPYYFNLQMLNLYNMYNAYRMYPYTYAVTPPMYHSDYERQLTDLKDYGPEPFVINIEEATIQNDTFRTALWTGKHLQLTLMSIDVDDDIGLEVHPNVDQFIRIEEGDGLVQMGDQEDELDFEEEVSDDFAIIIPAGKWHNIINTGNTPLKLYSIYAPPNHPRNTVHETKADAEAAEEHNSL